MKEPEWMRGPGFLPSLARVVWSIVLAVLLGIGCGAICGAIILSFGTLSGHSRTTGMEYVGAWDPAVALIGAVYGAFLGAFVTPVAYIMLVWPAAHKRALTPAFAGTLIGGFAGQIVGPNFSPGPGVLGMFMALILFRLHMIFAFFRERRRHRAIHPASD